jgi:glycosyltransferase involved in cell wall biosynthesis
MRASVREPDEGLGTLRPPRSREAVGAMRVTVELAQEFDEARHRAANARGEAPDATPYGLHHLADDPDVEVTFRPSLVGRAADLARRVRNHTGNYEVLASLDSALGPGRGRRRAADVVLCMDERTGFPAALLPCPVPVVSNVIWLGRPETYPRDRRAVLERAVRGLAGLVVQSHSLTDDLVDGWALDPARVHPVRVGIDPAFFPSQPWTPGTTTVAAVGDDPFRDHPTLIEAVRRARDRGVDAHLELATTRRDVELDEPWAQLHRQRMEGGVRDMYRRAGVVGLALHPSTRGSGSTVVLEAAASARPVVATRTPAMEALIADGERGLLVEPGDTDAMADALASLLADPDRARTMGEAARRWVEQERSSAVMAADIREALERTLVMHAE